MHLRNLPVAEMGPAIFVAMYWDDTVLDRFTWPSWDLYISTLFLDLKLFSSSPCYYLSSYWFFSFISSQTGFQWLEQVSQVGLTTDHFSCCLSSTGKIELEGMKVVFATSCPKVWETLTSGRLEGLVPAAIPLSHIILRWDLSMYVYQSTASLPYKGRFGQKLS